MLDEHALLAASDADRWIHCPASVRLTQHYPDRDEDFAAEGTVAHALAELLLMERYFAAFSQDQLDEIKRSPHYNQAMLDYVNEFISVVDQQFALASNAYDESSDEFKAYLNKQGIASAIIMFEDRLDTSEYIPEGFGTSDVVIIGGNQLFITDLKFGKGKPVSATDNSQLKAYALGALKKYKKYTDFVMDVTLTIVQPRLHSTTSARLQSTALAKWGKNVLRPAAQLAYSGRGGFESGKWCQFCPIKNTCETRADRLLEGVDFTPPNQLTTQRIAEIVKKGSEVKQWIAKVEAHALNLALAGVPIDGYKLVQGKQGKRTINDPEALEIDLAFAGYETEKLKKPATLHGITELEKHLGLQAFDELVTPYLTTREGSPKLAPTTDKRPEWQPFNAAEAFDEWDD